MARTIEISEEEFNAWQEKQRKRNSMKNTMLALTTSVGALGLFSAYANHKGEQRAEGALEKVRGENQELSCQLQAVSHDLAAARSAGLTGGTAATTNAPPPPTPPLPAVSEPVQSK